MSAAPLITLAAEAEASGVNHWVVGAGVLLLLTIAVFALLAFGAGRDHS
jgi:Flp pilus assembly protein protease CpaA